MLNLSKINAVGKIDYLPTERIENLPKDVTYSVTRLATLDTRFGEKYIMDLNDEKTIYLPRRVETFFNENPEEYHQIVLAVHDNRIAIRFLEGPYNQFTLFEKM